MHQLLIRDYDAVQHWMEAAGFVRGELGHRVGATCRPWTQGSRTATIEIEIRLGGTPLMTKFFLTDDTALATQIKLAIPEAFQ